MLEVRYSRGKTDRLDEFIEDSRSGESEQHDVIDRQPDISQSVVRVGLHLSHSNVLIIRIS